MTTGSWAMGVDSYNRSFKTWSGVDGRSHPNAYTATISNISSQAPVMWDRRADLPPDYLPYWHENVPTWHSNMLPSLPIPHLSLSSNDELRALSRLANQIRGVDFNAGIFLAEAGKTLNGVVDSTRAVLEAFRHVRSLRPDLALRSLARVVAGISRDDYKRASKLNIKDVSGTWLSLQYHWKPLLSGIYDAMQTFTQLNAERRQRFVVEQSSTDVVQVTTSGLKVSRRCTTKWRVTVKESPSIQTQLGLSDPLPMLWERLPYSFVVDWFVPIGTFLDTASVLNLLSAQTVKTVFQEVYYSGTQPEYVTGSLKFQGARWRINQVQLVRTVSDLPPVPFPGLNDWSKAFSKGHIANAAALITQQIRLSR